MDNTNIGHLVDQDATFKDVTGDDTHVVDEVEEMPDGSILSTLKERRQSLAERATKVLDIPGYNGMLAAEYRRMPYEQVAKLLHKAQKAKNAQVELAVVTDMLVQACEQILVRNEDNDLVPLHELVTEFGEDPVRYDSRLAKATGATGDRARIICQGVFENDLALVAHNNELVQWWKGVDTDDEDEDDADF